MRKLDCIWTCVSRSYSPPPPPPPPQFFPFPPYLSVSSLFIGSHLVQRLWLSTNKKSLLMTPTFSCKWINHKHHRAPDLFTVQLVILAHNKASKRRITLNTAAHIHTTQDLYLVWSTMQSTSQVNTWSQKELWQLVRSIINQRESWMRSSECLTDSCKVDI